MIKRFTPFFIITSFLILLSSFTRAQNDVVLTMKGTVQNSNTVAVSYSIPYPGYVEFVLFNSEGKKIWYGAGVKERGDHSQKLKRDKMEAGTTYSYQLKYKGKTYSGTFDVG